MARNSTITDDMRREAVEGQLLIGPGDTFDPDTETAFQQWRDALDTSQSTAEVRVMRVPMDESGNPMLSAKGQAHLFSVPVDQYNLDEIIVKVRREFMPRPMKLTAVRCMGFQKGVSGLRFNRIIMIEKGEEPESAKNNDSPTVTELIALINAQSKAADDRAERMMQQILEARSQALPPRDPIAIATELMTAMGGFIGRIPAPAVAALPATSNPVSQMSETLLLLQTFHSFMSKLQGGKSITDEDDDGEGIGSIVKSVAKAVQPLAEGYAENAKTKRELLARQGPRRLSPPNAAPVAAPSAAATSAVPPSVAAAPGMTAMPSGTAPTNEQKGEAEMLNEIGPQLENVCNLAAQGADPKDAAGLLLDLLPDKFDDALWRLVSSPRFVKSLAVLNPKVKLHEAWFEQFRQAIIADYEAGSDGSDDDEPANDSLGG